MGHAGFWRDIMHGREDPRYSVSCGRNLIWTEGVGGVGWKSTEGQLGPDDGVEFYRPC